MKKLKDNEISLLMDFTGIPVSIPLQALFTFFSSGDISTEAVVFCNWFPVMWQMAACFFAIRYIRKNPNDRRVRCDIPGYIINKLYRMCPLGTFDD